MRILIYGINFWPELTGIGKYSGEMADWLASRGHEVTVVTAPPYYPQWRLGEGYSTWRYRREVRQHSVIYRCPLWIPKTLRTRTRFLHLLSFALSSAPVVLWRALRWRPQIILTVQPPFMCGPVAWFGSRLCGAKAWMHVQDWEIDAAFELGMLHGTWLKRIMRRVERFLMARLDHVSAVSPQMLERSGTKGVNERRTTLFTNWVDTESIFPMRSVNPFKAELHLQSDKLVVLYSGNMGRKQGLELLVEAARQLTRDTNLVFVLAGDGSLRESLQLQAKGLPNLFFLPLQPSSRLNALLNLADIHVLVQRSQATGCFMPSKLTGMLASGRPIIATAEPESEVAQIVEECGLLVRPGHLGGLVSAIRQLAGNPDLRRLFGDSARQSALAKWDKQKVLLNFESVLSEQMGIANNPRKRYASPVAS